MDANQKYQKFIDSRSLFPETTADACRHHSPSIMAQ
jgi:hypothetical protein